MNHPITFRWNGEVMTPRQKWQASRQFESGHEYTLVEHEERSSASHAHFFATVNEAWKTLPDHLARRYPDATHLRKWLLIKRGFSIDRTIVAETDESAREIAALAGQLDPSAVIVTQGNIVTVSVARSQKSGPNGMNKDDFQRSKSCVLEELAIMLGVDVATLSSQIPNSSGGLQTSDRTDAPEDHPGPHPVQSSGASHSHSSGAPVANGLTDTPAASDPGRSIAAGVTHPEASLLSDDWRDVYIVALAGTRDKAASLLTRHAEAIQMIGGDPNAAELAWMRRAWRLVQRRNEAKLKRGEYEVEIEKLKLMPLLAAQNAA